MVLFPIALVWIAVVIVWVIRNERKPYEGEPRTGVRRRPRPPRDPRRGRPNDAGGRRGDAHSSRETPSPRP